MACHARQVGHACLWKAEIIGERTEDALGGLSPQLSHAPILGLAGLASALISGTGNLKASTKRRTLKSRL